MTQLFINIKELVQVREPNILKVSGDEMKILPTIKNVFAYPISRDAHVNSSKERQKLRYFKSIFVAEAYFFFV